MKCIQTKEINAFIIMKKYIRKFVRLNTKTSEEDRYYYHKKDKPIVPMISQDLKNIT